MIENKVSTLLTKIQRAAAKEDIDQVTSTYKELRGLLIAETEDMSEQNRSVAMVMIRALDKEISQVCNTLLMHDIVDELENDIVNKDMSLANSVLDRYRLGNQ
jgi:predicted component of type VI protein secretion system